MSSLYTVYNNISACYSLFFTGQSHDGFTLLSENSVIHKINSRYPCTYNKIHPPPLSLSSLLLISFSQNPAYTLSLSHSHKNTLCLSVSHTQKHTHTHTHTHTYLHTHTHVYKLSHTIREQNNLPFHQENCIFLHIYINQPSSNKRICLPTSEKSASAEYQQKTNVYN